LKKRPEGKNVPTVTELRPCRLRKSFENKVLQLVRDFRILVAGRSEQAIVSAGIRHRAWCGALISEIQPIFLRNRYNSGSPNSSGSTVPGSGTRLIPAGFAVMIASVSGFSVPSAWLK